jgi:hypothetical protein
MFRRVAGVGLSVVVVLGVVAGPASASDKAVAKGLVVTRADVGTGYTAAKGSSTPDPYPQVAACVGTPVAKRVVSARVVGPEFTNSQDGSVITSSADVVKTAAMAKTDRQVISDPKFADCLAQYAKDQLVGQGVTEVSAQRVNVKPYGSYSTAIETHVSGTSNGQPLELTAIQVGIIKGRAEVNASFVTNGSQPFDQSQGQAILDKLNRRLKKAKT